MEKYVIDTNIFFNMEEGLGLGDNTKTVAINLTQIAFAKKASLELYMPPRVREEFLSFFENKNEQFVEDLFKNIIIMSPDLNKISFSAAVFSQLVDDIRQRSYRGLNIAEEEIEKAGRLMSGTSDLSKKDFEIKIGAVVKNFRERYRQATRYGFLDSLADLDLIALSKEVDGYLISADDGVMKWGRTFGVKEMSLPVFGAKMRDYLHLQG